MSQSGTTLSFGYDALSRLLTQTGPHGTLTSTWDAAGRRTKLEWDDGFYVSYDYDMFGNMKKIRENGAASGIGLLARYSYDDLGNRIHATYGNGTASAWTPDPVGRLEKLIHNMPGTASDLTRTFTYNPAGQIASETSSNGSFPKQVRIGARCAVWRERRSTPGCAIRCSSRWMICADGRIQLWRVSSALRMARQSALFCGTNFAGSLRDGKIKQLFA